MCFDAASVGAEGGPSLVDCPWTPDVLCDGELAVPRGGQVRAGKGSSMR